MRPWFTSLDEWSADARAGERGYVREATGYVVRAGLLGIVVLGGVLGATDPTWLSPAMLTVYGLSLAGGAGAGALLFRREWRAAARTYGLPAAPDVAALPHR